MIPLTPDFNTESLNITAIAGDTVTLPCAMEFKESYKVGNSNVAINRKNRLIRNLDFNLQISVKFDLLLII